MRERSPRSSRQDGVAKRLRLAIVAAAPVASALLLSACGGVAAPGRAGSACDTPRPCRVLFVGNSYTYVNDLPAMFARLAAAGGHTVKVAELVEGGASLADHVASAETAVALASTKWNVVVLQEQSEIPSSVQLRRSKMYPAARRLVGMIRRASALPMFFVTWAHRGGWPADGLAGYRSMQSAVDQGYLAIAEQLRVPIAPVGYAWSTALTRHTAALWQRDGTHPTLRGTYLAACVFYVSVFGKSPQGLSYTAGLPARVVTALQSIAANAR